MLRRKFLQFAAVFFDFWDWHLHIWCKVNCQNGPKLYLVLHGAAFKLTEKERDFIDMVAKEMAKL